MAGCASAWYTDNGIAAASAEVAQVVRAAAYSLEDNAAAVEEARPACLERAYDLEMKLLGADGGDALRGAPRSFPPGWTASRRTGPIWRACEPAGRIGTSTAPNCSASCATST